MCFFNDPRMRRVLGSREGQMSLIMIFLVAIGLIFFAVTLNWSKIASLKTMTTVASNAGAARLASSMASYGENPVQSSLEGKRKKCAFSPFFAKLLLVIIIVAIILMAFFCPPCASVLGPITSSVTTLVISLVAAGLAMVLQATVVEPGINNMWNKLQQNIPRIEDQFAESALQVALERAVSDQVKVNDMSDYDMDGEWCKDAADQTCPKISRFAYYYTKRMLGIKPVPSALLEAYQKFRAKLGEFVGENLGVVTKRTDPSTGTYVYDIEDTCCLVNNADPTKGTPMDPFVNEQYCNSCCTTLPLREPLCGVGGTTIVDDKTIQDMLNGAKEPPPVPPECENGPYQKNYPLSYDSMFCQRFYYQRNNYSTNFLQFPYPPPTDPTFKTNAYAAVVGVDDGVDIWSRIVPQEPPPPGLPHKENWPDLLSPSDLLADSKYRGKDSEGKLFPFMWFMKETQTRINGLTYSMAKNDPQACHWCKETEECVNKALEEGFFQRSDEHLGYGITEYEPPKSATNDNLYCVNRFEGFPNSWVDCRADPEGCATEDFGFEMDNVRPYYEWVGWALLGGSPECPGYAEAGVLEKQGAWAVGNDRYCSSAAGAPYFSGLFRDGLCAKFDRSIETCFLGGGLPPVQDDNEPEIDNYSTDPSGEAKYWSDECACADVGLAFKPLWKDDIFDLTGQMMSDLGNDTRMILMDREERYYKEVDQWGQKAKRWIANMEWVTQQLIGFQGAAWSWATGGEYTMIPSADPVWCMPALKDVNKTPTDNYVELSYKEQEEIAAGGAWGTLPSVLDGCLEFNTKNQEYFDSLADPYQKVMEAKRRFLACVYPLADSGYQRPVELRHVDTETAAPQEPYTPSLRHGYSCETEGGAVAFDCKKFGDSFRQPKPVAALRECVMCGESCCGGEWVKGECFNAGTPCNLATGAGCILPDVCWPDPQGVCNNDHTWPCQYDPCPTGCIGKDPTGAPKFIGKELDTAAREFWNLEIYPECKFGKGDVESNGCSYTFDCNGQPVENWKNTKKALAEDFCNKRHGKSSVAEEGSGEFFECSPYPADPASTDGFMRMIERDWHRTLTKKSLYAGLGPETLSRGSYKKDVTDVRGWKTMDLVGKLDDPCRPFYHFCMTEFKDPGCVDMLPMCEADPIFTEYFLKDSALLAAKQEKKLKKRIDYLSQLQGHAFDLAGSLPQPLSGLSTVVQDAENWLKELIRLNEEEKNKPPQLPNWVTYVWQSPPPTNAPPGSEGYWHAVKVEALLPRRCAIFDNAGGSTPDYDGFDCCAGDGKTRGENKNRFPWIRAYSSHWKTRRCYEMWDESGCVKVRVSRFDEDHTIQGSVIKFLNGLSLWQFLYRHPLSAGDPVIKANLGTCKDGDPDARGAFITYPGAPNAALCEAAAEKLIQQGFISETCARYELKPDPAKPEKWTYDISFRECKHCCRELPEYHKLEDD